MRRGRLKRQNARLMAGRPDESEEIATSAMVMVAVLTSGWQLTVSLAIKAASSTTWTRGGRSLISPKGVTAPGDDAERLGQELRPAEGEPA